MYYCPNYYEAVTFLLKRPCFVNLTFFLWKIKFYAENSITTHSVWAVNSTAAQFEIGVHMSILQIFCKNHDFGDKFSYCPNRLGSKFHYYLKGLGGKFYYRPICHIVVVSSLQQDMAFQAGMIATSFLERADKTTKLTESIGYAT